MLSSFTTLATSWIDVMPVMSRSDANTVDAFNRFTGPHNDIKMMHTDQAKELVSANCDGFTSGLLRGCQRPTASLRIRSSWFFMEHVCYYAKPG